MVGEFEVQSSKFEVLGSKFEVLGWGRRKWSVSRDREASIEVAAAAEGGWLRGLRAKGQHGAEGVIL
jgi:hypothetical protein